MALQSPTGAGPVSRQAAGGVEAGVETGVDRAEGVFSGDVAVTVAEGGAGV